MRRTFKAHNGTWPGYLSANIQANVCRVLTYVVPICNILETLKITLALHLGDLLFRLVGNATVTPLVLKDVQEPEDLVQNEIQAETSKHSSNTAVICRGLRGLEELRPGDLSDAVAYEDPSRGSRPLSTACDIG